MIDINSALYVNLSAIHTQDSDMDLRAALQALKQLYWRLDDKLIQTTANLAIPCRALDVQDKENKKTPCHECCHESVFLTPLEWFYIVDYMQTHFSESQLHAIILYAHTLYHEHKSKIDALFSPLPDGVPDHFEVAKQIRFACPLLGPQGCQIYPARELYARLFGQSYFSNNQIYGCSRSIDFFSTAILSQKLSSPLVSARAFARMLDRLPLTHMRQVFPYYFYMTYQIESLSS